jgi:hypothetical protein
MSLQNKPGRYVPPVVDEWGFYDPERAGFAAVVERLELRRSSLPQREEPLSMFRSTHDAVDIRVKR